MAFDAWYDPTGAYFNTVIFPRKMRTHPIKWIGVYLLKGIVAAEFGVTLTHLEKLPYVRDERFGE